MQELIKLEEQYSELLEECAGIIYETKFDLALRDIEWRHKLGEAIANSALLKKYAHGKGEFIERIGRDLKMSKSLIYQCVDFYEKYPKLSTAVETFSPEKKALKWSDIRLTLKSGDQEEGTCDHKKINTTTLVITRVKCRDCGKLISETKENGTEN